jgi:hypothetical protein
VRRFFGQTGNSYSMATPKRRHLPMAEDLVQHSCPCNPRPPRYWRRVALEARASFVCSRSMRLANRLR